MLREDGAPFLALEMLQVETDQGWQSDYMFHQPDFESRLRGSLAAEPHVDLWLGWEVTALKQYEGGVEISLKEQKTAQVTTLRAAYVVGSDGVSSFVRQWMTTEVEDFHATQRSLIVDIFPFEHPEGLPRTSAFIHCRPNLQALPLIEVDGISR
jgi:3-(3-hydroxy-phenyl)propionate hydroxylase